MGSLSLGGECIWHHCDGCALTSLLQSCSSININGKSGNCVLGIYKYDCTTISGDFIPYAWNNSKPSWNKKEAPSHFYFNRNFYFCNSLGELYEYDLNRTGSEAAVLDLGLPTALCDGNTMICHDAGAYVELVFPLTQNGLFAIGAYRLP